VKLHVGPNLKIPKVCHPGTNTKTKLGVYFTVKRINLTTNLEVLNVIIVGPLLALGIHGNIHTSLYAIHVDQSTTHR